MRLLWIPMAALLLAGCVVVPYGPHVYTPRHRVTYYRAYPAYPAHPHGWYAPRHHHRQRHHHRHW